MDLYDYQETARQDVWLAFEKGRKRILLSCPTGGGKTRIAQAIIEDALQRKLGKVAFIADRLALVDQTFVKFIKGELYCGVQKGSRRSGLSFPVQIISAGVAKNIDLSQYGLIIVDECHTMWEGILSQVVTNDIPLLGLTATPTVPGLGNWYQEIISTATTIDLLRREILAPITAFRADVEIDMEDEAGRGALGEWTGEQVETHAKKIVGDIVGEWERRTLEKFSGPVKTLVFAPTVNYAAQLVTAFRAKGHGFGLVTYKDTYREREAKLEGLRGRYYTGLVSVDALTKGLDIPEIQCLSAVRSYKRSLAAWLQSLGRGMRSAEGKKHCLLLDHSGNWVRHYTNTLEFWNEGVDELLVKGEKAQSAVLAEEEVKPYICVCGFIWPLNLNAKTCPECGQVRAQRKPEEYKEDATKELEEVGTYNADTVSVEVAKIRAGRSEYAADLEELASSMFERGSNDGMD